MSERSYIHAVLQIRWLTAGLGPSETSVKQRRSATATERGSSYTREGLIAPYNLPLDTPGPTTIVTDRRLGASSRDQCRYPVAVFVDPPGSSLGVDVLLYAMVERLRPLGLRVA